MIIRKLGELRLLSLLVLSLVLLPANADEAIYQLGNVMIDSRAENELLIYNLVEDEELNLMAKSENQISSNTTYKLSKPIKKLLSANLPYRAEILHAAHQTKLEVALIDAVIAVESGYDAKAVSKKGAVGLMQVMPETARSLNAKNLKPDSVKHQVMIGALYLKKMLDLFDGNLTLALAAYNAGPEAIKKHHGKIPPYQETQRYVPKVLAYYDFLKSQKH